MIILRLLAYALLVIESATSAFWQLFCWCIAFSSIWLLKWPTFLGSWAEKGTTLIFVIGFLFLLRKGINNFSLPDKNDVYKKLENDSKIKHRPLRAEKECAIENSNQPLWNLHKKQLKSLLPFIKKPIPKAILSEKDPYAIRFALILFFIIALIFAGPMAKNNLYEGLFPFSWQKNTKDTERVSITFVPPEYTHIKEQTYTKEDTKNASLSLPEGTLIKARVKKPVFTPKLYIDGSKYKLNRADKNNYIRDMLLPEGQTLLIKEGFLTKAKIPYHFIKDTPPSIIFEKAPETNTSDASFKLPLRVMDDYGIQTITLSIELAAFLDNPPLGEPITEERTLSLWTKQETEQNEKEGVQIQPIYDIADHSWAGLPVALKVTIKDHAGQTATAERAFVLPERTFQHPVAQTLANMRKKLAWEPINEAPEITRELETLLHFPENFENDTIVFLAITSAASRLHYNPSKETAKAVIALLWETALRIEEGNLGLAERNMKQAKEALKKLLSDPNATEEDIARAMFDLQQAMQNYFLELSKELHKRLVEGDQPFYIPPELVGNMVNPNDLADFMQQMETEALEGNKDKANEMLKQLEQMMDVLSPDMAAPMPEEIKEMAEAMEMIQNLIEQQQSLLEDTQNSIEQNRKKIPLKEGTYQPTQIPLDNDLIKEWNLGDMPPIPMTQGENGQGPTNEPSNGSNGSNGEIAKKTKEQKTRQDALRFMLDQLIADMERAIGQSPKTMRAADQEMQKSSNKLEIQNPKGSLPHQKQALEHLKNTAQNINKSMMERLQKMTGLSFGNNGRGRDPLGRSYGENGNSFLNKDKANLPNEATRKRIEHILSILRARSGDLDRPLEERKYYKRLLRRW